MTPLFFNSVWDLYTSSLDTQGRHHSAVKGLLHNVVYEEQWLEEENPKIDK